jgi:hypothetical protein
MSSPLPDVAWSRQGSGTGKTAAAALGIANNHKTTIGSNLFNANKSGNYHHSLHGYYHQQGTLQHPGSNVMTQNFMEILRQQQQLSPSKRLGSLRGSIHVASFAQLPATMASATIPVQYRVLKNDTVSGNELIQRPSIERTNDLLAQKLALMQQTTMMTSNNSGTALYSNQQHHSSKS